MRQISWQRLFSPRIEPLPNPDKYIVQVSKLESCEVYLFPEGSEEKVLKGINFDVKRGDIWGIVGNEPFEVDLLLEIVGSVRPYGSGRCILAERGMMRKKRKVLPHVFFIADGDVTFPNMNTLEYLMFATANLMPSPVERQALILQTLLDTELYYLTLVPIRDLTRAEKAVISLLAASFSKALLVIFSVSQLDFDERLAAGIRGIAGIISGRGGAMLIGSRDCGMVQTACTHAGLLVNGKMDFCGPIGDLLSGLDKRVFILDCKNPKKLMDSLKKSDSGLRFREYGQELHVYDDREPSISQSDFLELIRNTDITVESLRTSKKTLENAYREVLSGHDL